MYTSVPPIIESDMFRFHTCSPTTVPATISSGTMCQPEKGSPVRKQMCIRDRHHIISNASCTTNCLAPFAKVLLDNFGTVSYSQLDSRAARDMVDIARRVVPLCATSCAEWRRMTRKLERGDKNAFLNCEVERPCFDAHVGLGPGACCGRIAPCLLYTSRCV